MGVTNDLQFSPSDNTKLLLTNYDLTLTTTLADCVVQRLKIRLLRFLGEWFLNTSLGMPYLQAILNKNTPRFLIESYFKTVILGTQDVVRLTAFTMTYVNRTRTMSIAFTVSLSDGTSVSVVI